MLNDHFLALPQDVLAFAWSAPMRDLARSIGISDVGLKKLLRASGIVTPPQGYWNKLRAGRRVPSVPKAPERRAGETGRIRLDGRFRGHVPEAQAMAEEGPFASRYVPEDLDQLRTDELKAIGRVTVASQLARPHPGLSWVLKRDDKRRQKFAESHWSWDQPQWDGPLAQRQLRIADALLKTLAKRGHSGSASEEDGALTLRCPIGDMHVTVKFALPDRHGARGQRLSPIDGGLPASTALCLMRTSKLRAAFAETWKDDGKTRLERQVAEIAADLIAAGEASFRESLVEAREWAEKMARWREERRRAEREELENKRVADLQDSGELLRQAGAIRALVASVKAAIEAGDDLGVSADQLTSWEAWAHSYADRLDPVKSRQVLTHLVVPMLDHGGSAPEES